MLDTETKNEITHLTNLIKHSEKELQAHIENEFLMSPKAWDKIYNRLVDELNVNLERLDTLTKNVFLKNFCKSVQTSVNSCRAKVGLKVFILTAII